MLVDWNSAVGHLGKGGGIQEMTGDEGGGR